MNRFRQPARLQGMIRPTIVVFALVSCAWAQADGPREQSAGKQIGSGAASIGTGAAKGAGEAAKGAGKGALDLVTLHPIGATASVGGGAVAAGKDIGVGTVKGTGKIAKGVGHGLRKLF